MSDSSSMPLSCSPPMAFTGMMMDSAGEPLLRLVSTLLQGFHFSKNCTHSEPLPEHTSRSRVRRFASPFGFTQSLDAIHSLSAELDGIDDAGSDKKLLFAGLCQRHTAETPHLTVPARTPTHLTNYSHTGAGSRTWSCDIERRRQELNRA